ncbi:WhiB family transcriptional regulator [Streptomyces smyrnaeus]|uniref:WhiB family transcriptional regulator n=1 Tax=Streptomyces smyrnaeus TaxID=1387713 RepID=UPI00369A12E8
MPRPSRYAPDNLPRPYHWSDDAVCQGEETALFFPAGKNGVPVTDEQYAKTFCSRCPVRIDCLRHALTFREDYGVWGGFSESERAEMLREARLEAERRRRRELKERRAQEAADATTAA